MSAPESFRAARITSSYTLTVPLRATLTTSSHKLTVQQHSQHHHTSSQSLSDSSRSDLDRSDMTSELEANTIDSVVYSVHMNETLYSSL